MRDILNACVKFTKNILVIVQLQSSFHDVVQPHANVGKVLVLYTQSTVQN
jgi:hypothetical protein